MNLQDTLRNYFNGRIEQDPKDYQDEYTIYNKQNPNGLQIEVVTRAVALNNELDFINDIKERNEFIKSVAEQEEPEEIGAYIRIAKDVYYREL